MSLFGRRRRLTREGKQRAWQIASESFLATANSMDKQLEEVDIPQVMDAAKERMESAGIPQIIWQIVLSYIAQLIVNWIIQKYLTPPAFPADTLGDDDE